MCTLAENQKAILSQPRNSSRHIWTAKIRHNSSWIHARNHETSVRVIGPALFTEDLKFIPSRFFFLSLFLSLSLGYTIFKLYQFCRKIVKVWTRIELLVLSHFYPQEPFAEKIPCPRIEDRNSSPSRRNHRDLLTRARDFEWRFELRSPVSAWKGEKDRVEFEFRVNLVKVIKFNNFKIQKKRRRLDKILYI